jgi:hypothetical protein
MGKIGMTHDAVDDFDHWRLAEGHCLRRQALPGRKRSGIELGQNHTS